MLLIKINLETFPPPPPNTNRNFIHNQYEFFTTVPSLYFFSRCSSRSGPCYMKGKVRGTGRGEGSVSFLQYSFWFYCKAYIRYRYPLINTAVLFRISAFTGRHLRKLHTADLIGWRRWDEQCASVEDNGLIADYTQTGRQQSHPEPDQTGDQLLTRFP